MKVLSTRELTESQRAYAHQLELEVEERSFLKVTHCPEVLFEAGKPLPILSDLAVDVWLISSSNAIPTVKALLPFIEPPLMGVVGEKTAYKLEKQLGIPADFIGSNAVSLAQQLTQRTDLQRFFFFSGNRRLETLPNALSIAGKELLEWTVYETDLIAHSILDCPPVVLFFSPTGVEAFLEKNTWEADYEAVVIGATTAASFLRRTGFSPHIAPTPTVESVLETVASLQPSTRQSI